MIVVFLLHPTLNAVSFKLILYIGIAATSGLILYYMDENRQRLSYLDQLKIKRLLKEQKIIFEDLPDGLMIHQQEDKQLQFTNNAFQKLIFKDLEDDLTKVKIRYTDYEITANGLH